MNHVIKTKLLHPLSDILTTTTNKDVIVGDLEGEKIVFFRVPKKQYTKN
jgi:hypothetical protein